MLLWPHPLIAGDRFIAADNDDRLIGEALAKLAGLSFVDVIENQGMTDNLRRWLGRPFNYQRVNETNRMPADRRCSLDHEISDDAANLLAERSRLDVALWANVAAHRAPGHDIDQLREDTIAANLRRYRRLVEPSPVAPALMA